MFSSGTFPDHLELPEFLSSKFGFDNFAVVNIKDLYVGLVPVEGNKIQYISIYNTPHYVFAKNHISGDLVVPVAGYEDYSEYSVQNSSACPSDKFWELIESIKENDYDWKHRPILVFRHWRRPFPLGRKDVADGFHRLAVIAAMGKAQVIVARLKHKDTFIDRMLSRGKKSSQVI